MTFPCRLYSQIPLKLGAVGGGGGGGPVCNEWIPPWVGCGETEIVPPATIAFSNCQRFLCKE